MQEKHKLLNQSQDEPEVEETDTEQTEQIIKTGSVSETKGKYPIHCLTIVGQIEGHSILPPQTKTTKYEHVIPQLVAIEENPDVKGLLILLPYKQEIHFYAP